jgi:hypothetical protein
MNVNLHVLLKIHPAAYRYNSELIPTVPRFAVGRSDNIGLFVCVQGYIDVNAS